MSQHLIANDSVTLHERERQQSAGADSQSRDTSANHDVDGVRRHSNSASAFDGTPNDVDTPNILRPYSRASMEPPTPRAPAILLPHNVHLIAFVNANSGGKQGKKIAVTLAQELGADNVFNLGDIDPLIPLEKHLHTPNLRIAVCGGDGTVNWLLSCVGALPFNPTPAVGILPLGTGNDTSRVFGWGHGYTGRKQVINNIRKMKTCPSVPFDRWHATIEHSERLSDAQVKGLPAAMREQKQEPKFLGYRPPSKKDMNDPEYRAVVGADNVEEKAEADGFAQSPHGLSDHDKFSYTHTHTDATADTGTDTKPHFNPHAHSLEHLERIGSANLISPHAENHLHTTDWHDHRKHNERSSHATSASNNDALVKREAQFNNYLSFGIDAQIQFEFHEHRENNRHLYFSRICNMGWMTCWGAINLVCCMAQPLNIKIEVPDGDTDEWREIVVPPNLSSIVLLNGTTYAGGRSIWGRSASRRNEYDGSPPSFNDGLIEIMGTENTWHLTMMLIKVRRAVRIAQVHECRITSSSPIHAQLDGEPWVEQSSVYHIRRIHQAVILDANANKHRAARS